VTLKAKHIWETRISNSQRLKIYTIYKKQIGTYRINYSEIEYQQYIMWIYIKYTNTINFV